MSITYRRSFFDSTAGKYGEGEERFLTVVRSTVDPVVLIENEAGELLFSWSPERDNEVVAIAGIILDETRKER